MSFGDDSALEQEGVLILSEQRLSKMLLLRIGKHFLCFFFLFLFIFIFSFLRAAEVYNSMKDMQKVTQKKDIK